MEPVLLIVTLVSLAVAIGTSFLAWRVMREDRLRSEARIAALAADLEVDDREPRIRAERLEREAPPFRTAASTAAAEIDLPIDDAAVTAAEGMFAVRQRGRSMPRVVAGIAVAAVLVLLVIGTLVMTSARSSPAATIGASAPPETTSTAAALPLELVALGHEREKDRLTVHGVVRGASTDSGPLTAVVLLFNREGSEIGSGRAEVAPAGADPASERRFVVTVPSPDEVGRYRISFRSADRVVPHVDRRTPPGTANAPVLNLANPQLQG